MTQPLDTRQLRAFVTLARRGSFTLAAKELHLSQSAVSHSMKALETEVGCRLFDRLGKKVLLTQAGEQLLEYAGRIVRDMEAARESISQLSRWGKTRLRIGASTTICQYILPQVLCQFAKAYPQAHLLIEPADSPQVMDLLRTNAIDLAIALEPDRRAEVDFHSLFSDEMHFVTAPGHPWARAGRVMRDEIPKQCYALYKKTSYTSVLVEDYFRSEDIVLNTVMQLGSMEATKEIVKLGLAISILAPWIARKELDGGELVALPLGKRKLKRNWGILHVRGRRLSMAEETFLKECLAATAAPVAKPSADESLGESAPSRHDPAVSSGIPRQPLLTE